MKNIVKQFFKKTYYKDDASRIFCISMQRTGTTSVGRFFRDFGYDWAGWPADQRNEWSSSWYDGDFEHIFSSEDFRSANAFEDSPWFFPEFYKILFHRFPNSKFILFTRDANTWFDSMVKHSNGDIIGKANFHTKIYRRELEYYELLSKGKINPITENQVFSKKKMKLTHLREHYKSIYYLHTIEVKDFFQRHSPASLFVGSLDDSKKWVKLGDFLGFKVPDNYISFENRSINNQGAV